MKWLVITVLASTHLLDAAVLTVSKEGRGEFNTIQAAVDRAKAGDEVVILDAATYEEQVTLKAPLHHFTLRSERPNSATKPTLRWLDQENVGPKTCLEGLDTSHFTWERNGALRLIGVRNVRIEGLTVDGVESKPFAYPGVWGNGKDCNGQLAPLFHGNSGIVLFRTGNVILRNCEVKNAYFGIHIKDKDRGPFKGPSRPEATALSRMALGNHLLDGNLIHYNTWGFFLESLWGLGSTFRNNFIFHNHHPEGQAERVRLMPNGEHQNSGAFLLMDGFFSTPVIHNNTFALNYLIFSGHFRAGATPLVVNNIFTKPHLYWNRSASFQNPFHEMTPYLNNRLKHNVFAAQTDAPPFERRSVSIDILDSITQQTVHVETTLVVNRYVPIMNSFPIPALSDSQIQLDIPVPSGIQKTDIRIDPYVKPGTVIAGGISSLKSLSAAARNKWLETEFLSEVLTDSNFLKPAPIFHAHLKEPWPELKFRDSSGQLARIGAQPPSERLASNLRITPLAPGRIVENQLVLDFVLESPRSGENRIRYLRLIPEIPYSLNSFGGGTLTPTPEADTLPIPQGSLDSGYHQIRIPAANLRRNSQAYGSVEMAVDGRQGLSNIASFPIIPLSSLFKVEVLNDSGVLTNAVETGKRLKVRVSYESQPAQIRPVTLFLASGAHLQILDSTALDASGSIQLPLPFTVPVQLQEIPVGGGDLICATSFTDSSLQVTGYGQSQALIFEGVTVSTQGKWRHPNFKNPGHPGIRDVLGRKTRTAKKSSPLKPSVIGIRFKNPG